MKKRNPNLRGAMRKYITIALALVITLASVTAATTAETHAAAKKGSAYWKIYQIKNGWIFAYDPGTDEMRRKDEKPAKLRISEFRNVL